MKAERFIGRDFAPAAAAGAVPGWHIACTARELRKRPLGKILAGRALVLFRDAGGQPGVLEDRCAHRNAPLSAGSICNGRLRCPYHGWEYERDGRVANVPACPSAAAGGETLRIEAYETLEQDGFVWVWLGSSRATGSPLRFPHCGERGWTSFTMRTRFEATVDACLENFLDCPHAAFVHRHWFRAPTGKPVRATVRSRDDGLEAEYFEEPREKSLVWWLLAPRQGAMTHTDRFIAPNTSRVDYAFPGGLQYVITSSCTPIGDFETEVTTVICFHHALGPLVRLFFAPLSRRIIRQDVKMLGLQATNIRRFGGPHFRSTAADLLGPGIVAWRRALARGEAPPAPTTERHVDLRL